jgi:hypothetical protein
VDEVARSNLGRRVSASAPQPGVKPVTMVHFMDVVIDMVQSAKEATSQHLRQMFKCGFYLPAPRCFALPLNCARLLVRRCVEQGG